MARFLVIQAIVFITTVIAFGSVQVHEVHHITQCPCSDPSLCDPITTPPRNELFIFLVQTTQDVWMKFDWNKITTVAIVNFYDAQLVCWAHSKNARVVNLVDYPVDDLLDADKRASWIQRQLQDVQQKFLDGVNIDFEDMVPPQSNQSEALTALVDETRRTFTNAIPGSQVTFDIAWSPNDIDGRGYDAFGLAQVAEFLIVMSYDEQSQIFDSYCTARANSGLSKTATGIRQFRDLGIDTDKLVLAVPWYGYNYVCINFLAENNTCYIEEVPFRGVNCSDAAGTQIPYTNIIHILNSSTTSGRIWNAQTKSPYFNFLDSENRTHQMWYDDPESLTLKYQYASDNYLRGIGMWNANFLNYNDTEEGEEERQQMWGALPSFKTNYSRSWQL